MVVPTVHLLQPILWKNYFSIAPRKTVLRTFPHEVQHSGLSRRIPLPLDNTLGVGDGRKCKDMLSSSVHLYIDGVSRFRAPGWHDRDHRAPTSSWQQSWLHIWYRQGSRIVRGDERSAVQNWKWAWSSKVLETRKVPSRTQVGRE